MSLRDVSLKMEYRSLIDNIAKEFYIPVLKEAVSYKRAVGFFSSSSLITISKGISELVKNGGHIQLVASPNLSEEDIEAIRKGYASRDDVIKKALFRELANPVNDYQVDKLNYLANLIADEIMDIRIAVTESNDTFGMYHEKVGIISDSHDNKIAFSGSMNESANAFASNYETIDVFTSWSQDSERVETKERAFDHIWSNMEQGIDVYEFPDITEEFIKKYKKRRVDYQNYDFSQDADPIGDLNLSFFKVPGDVDFYDYQKDAMAAWINNKCCGIFNMATGTGKTYTALGSICKLSFILQEKIAVLIVVPYIHLVEQWIEDINKFGVDLPIVAYGYSGNNWRRDFKNAVLAYNRGIIKNFCIITTNATFEGQDFQNLINCLKKDFLFVADEAHNLGAEKIRKQLPKKARYRLALSATFDRHQDEDGTAILRQFFGKECINFGLKDAIKKGFLTPYYYHPVVVILSKDELDEYKHLTKHLTKLIGNKSVIVDSNTRIKKQIEILLIKRARIIAGCKSKLDKLVDLMEMIKNEHHILVYCGATKYDNSDISDDDDLKQIDEVNRRLYEKLGMKVRKFTSSESLKDRQEIKKMFINESIQVITAIKCLDEGVNIPSIKKAFILASSTNPKEYIQRRGRVLRTSPGKEYADIYDFITLPRNIDDVPLLDEKEREYDKELMKREFERIKCFAECSRNPADSDGLIFNIQRAYKFI